MIRRPRLGGSSRLLASSPDSVLKMAAVKILVAFAFGWALMAGARGLGAEFPEEIPFVPTPAAVVDRMLELAAIKHGDVLYDLGSGDGRIVIRAASKYGIRAIGIEMDRILLEQARKAARAAGVTRLVEFRAQDALQTDLSEATIVTLYMLPWFNEKIKPNLQKYLRPGARIVAHDFAIAGWQPDKIVRLPEIEQKPGGYRHQHVLYLWQVRR